MEAGLFGPPDSSMWLRRPFGYWERELVKDLPMCAPGPRRCTINNVARLSVRPPYRINVEHFRLAVQATIYNEPHLRACADVHNLQWIMASDFSEVFEFMEDERVASKEGLLALAEEEANLPWKYESSKPLYRCKLISFTGGYVIMNIYHHGLGDGTSGTLILGSILKQYDLLESGKGIELSPLKPLPPTEDNLGMEVRGSHDTISVLLKEKVERAMDYSPAVPLDSEELEENYSSKLPINKANILDGARENFVKVIASCKQMGVTVGNLFIAASYMAYTVIHAKLFGQSLRSYDGIRGEYMDIPVNLRKRVKPLLGARYCSFYVTILSTRVDVGLTNKLWDLAREVGKQVRCSFEREDHLYFMEAKKQWENGEHKVLASQAHPKGVAGLVCSSLGCYPFDFEFQWGRIEGDYLTGCLFTPDAANFFFNLVSTDRFHYSLVYSPGKKNMLLSLEIFDCMFYIMEKAGEEHNWALSDILEAYSLRYLKFQ